MGVGQILRRLIKAGRVPATMFLLAPLAACGTAASQGPASQAALTPVTIAMGYFPNIQFAPFYVARARGYYRQAGLNVTFRNGIEPDVLALLTSGKAQFAVAAGDLVLAAGAQGRQVKYVLTQYARFPTAVFSLKQTGIRTPAQLRGHSIGVPGTYGATYVGLLSLLKSAGLSTRDVTIKTIGFSQAQIVAAHKIDAAVGYATNDVVQLTARGTAVNEIDVYKYANLASAGVVTSDAELSRHPGMVRAFVRATVRGLQETIAHPGEAYRISATEVTEIKAQPKVQHAVLARSIDFWRPEPGHALGWIDPRIWTLTARDLYRAGQIAEPVQASRFYTNRFTGAT